jgi:hypothetical protein
MENPEIWRLWLVRVAELASTHQDPFWQQYVPNFERFAKSNFAEPSIDAEAGQPA